MQNVPIVPVILSGGSGTRLWPHSRARQPKQFVQLLGDDGSLFQKTVTRLVHPEGPRPIVVCNTDHRFMVAEQLRDLGVTGSSILLEPVGRNTAPAIALAAFDALSQHDDPVLIAAPADHLIRDLEAFNAAIASGLESALAGQMVTFGIVPTSPETGYGYIRAQSQGVSAVSEFVEKPDQVTAQAYLDSGNYFWNSGIFMFKASAYLQELAHHAEGMHSACIAAYEAMSTDLDFKRIEEQSFLACPNDSVDYAVMEHTDKATVVPMDCGWSDVGSWDALWQVQEKTPEGNVFKGDVLSHNSRNNYVDAKKRLVALVGCENLTVVETPDAVLVADRAASQDIKKIVEQLKAQNRDEAELHSRVYRPWGNYEGIDEGPRYQVKRIVVSPGERLSLQKHHHRAEHWIVVSGTALITCGDKEFLMSENESTYIPLGEVHRLENPGKLPLELIEVQSGSYLGEDDIVRLEDVYGRSGTTDT